MSFKNWTVGKKLWFLATMSFLILATAEIFNNYNTHKLSTKLNEVAHTQLPSVRNMTLADMMHDGIRATVFRAILAMKDENKQELVEAEKEYKEFSENIVKYLNNIEQTEASAKIKEQIKIVKPDVQSYVDGGQHIIELAVKNDAAGVKSELPKFVEQFETLEKGLGTLGENIEKEADASLLAGDEMAQESERLSLILAIIGSVLFLSLFFYINRDLIQTLQSIVGHLESQLHSLHSDTTRADESAQKISVSTTQQSAAIQTTASALEEINSMVAKTSDHSQQLAKGTLDSNNLVQSGQKSISEMSKGIESINSSNKKVMQEIDESNNQIKQIVQVVSEIGEKTKVINDIVFQTKLLSFNASVEAARAGEQGKGFAVVAEEVGNLAQLSGSAAKEITQMLDNGIKQIQDIVENNQNRISSLMKESEKHVTSGIQIADQCDNVFAKIVEQTSEVSQLVNEMTTAIREQTIGLREINDSIHIFNQSTASNEDTARLTASTVENLKERFQSLQNLMGQLSHLVYGASEAKHAPLDINTTKNNDWIDKQAA